MLNIRTVILSVVLVVLLLLAVPLVAARTEVVSKPAGASVDVPENSEAPADQRQVPIASYRSRLDECFDVPVWEAAACSSASRVPVQADPSPIDECFDVSIWEESICRQATEAPTP